ncbi:MAG: hypothetical protein QW117_02575 [Candidatus Pacearchaeota archaeon]
MDKNYYPCFALNFEYEDNYKGFCILIPYRILINYLFIENRVDVIISKDKEDLEENLEDAINNNWYRFKVRNSLLKILEKEIYSLNENSSRENMEKIFHLILREYKI